MKFRLVRVASLTALIATSAELLASNAAAFCRTTTCDVSNPPGECPAAPPAGCNMAGKPLFWSGKCVSSGVQQDGSVTRGITADTMQGVVRTAFDEWQGVDCPGKPSIAVYDAAEPVVCNELQFNLHRPNANVWMFRDDAWPYGNAGSTLALTTVTANLKTGEILDADVELNSLVFAFTTDPSSGGSDLQAVVTHEAGHFLGLAHELDVEATMNPEYELSSRTLHADDVAGLCTIYPPNRNVPDCSNGSPRNGFSPDCQDDTAVAGPNSGESGCSCRIEGGPGRTPFSTLGAASVLLALFVARRRPK